MNESDGPRDFATAQWSLVVSATRDAESQSVANASQSYYRYPLYAFVRVRGYSAADAQDLTQSFFARPIETSGLVSADPTH